jgi:hypothetical protein
MPAGRLAEIDQNRCWRLRECYLLAARGGQSELALGRIPNERDYDSGTVPTWMNGHGARCRAVATAKSLSRLSPAI